jgi:cardiolipin synthase
MDYGAMDYAFGSAVVAAALLAAGHAVVYKREPRSAAVWLLVILLLPALGPVFYALFGLNRVQRRAARMRRMRLRRPPPNLEQTLPGTQLAPLARLVGAVAGRPLIEGNSVEPLVDGGEAFPAMLEAIEGARSCVALASYIFHRDGIGERFVNALAAAQRRGVAVRVLIDDVADRFSWASPAKPLRRAGVPVGVFNRTLVPARLHAMHLRNHRKILVVDGVTGFTGGFNIDRRYWGERACRDLHFRMTGPVVGQLMEVFAEDWYFATDEELRGAPWFCAPADTGQAIARVIEAGPDERVGRLRWAYAGALNEARRSARICTPYFLPDGALIQELNGAALRGVEVDIVLPEKSDLPHIQWAVLHQLWQVVERGCRVWLQPPPFDHSKLMVVDAEWTLFGSGNWDARSLRLNFELNVECYSRDLGRRMDELLRERRTRARPVTMEWLDSRPFPVKLRDGTARLFAPLL